MTQPLDRDCSLPAIGDIDSDAGEFWVENPFMLMQQGENLSAYERNRMFLNRNGKRFLDASFVSGTDIDSDSRGAVICDFNGDGAPDLLVSSTGGGPLRMFYNRFPRDNHWLRLRLQGTKSNANGIGSRVTVETKGQKIMRDLFPANGFIAGGPAELAIGIGNSEKANVTIEWPSGTKQTVTDVTAGKLITIKEE